MDNVVNIEFTEKATGWRTRLCSMEGCHNLVSWPGDEPTPPVCLPCWDAAVDAGEDWIERRTA